MKRPRRERRTAPKLYEQLVTEGYTGPYSPVQCFVRGLKRVGAGSGETFIPLHFAAGDALQFDWSEERGVLGSIEQKVEVAHFRLCHSRKPFAVAYPGEAQEMVLDAFARALFFYGGVPRRVIIDNPKNDGDLCLALEGPDIPSSVPGLDDPLRNGTGGLHPGRRLGEGLGREPTPVFAGPVVCTQACL
ncbi:transposase family protein [Rhodobacteraceae bacterium R_SAG3]|nr:transposase family protein [Rhodobacteraceae bacterium R_SAG3]